MTMQPVWVEKLLEFPCDPAPHGSKNKRINLFHTACKAKKPIDRKPVEIPETLLDYRE